MSTSCDACGAYSENAFVHGLEHEPECPYAELAAAYARIKELEALASPPIPAGQTLSAQPVASKELSDEQIKAALPPMPTFLRESLYDYEQRHVIAHVIQCVRAILAARPTNDADRKLIRAQALEEAAKLAERHYIPGHTVAGPHFAARCAAAIRALALPSVPGEKP